MENYFNLLIYLPTYSLTTLGQALIWWIVSHCSVQVYLSEPMVLSQVFFLAYIKAGKDKSECFCNDVTCFKNSQSLNCISFDISGWFEDGILTRARSKLLLCSWKAAEVFSARRIKREGIVKKTNSGKKR